MLSVITVSFCAGLIYVVVQQDLRQSANDPQIEISEDIASQLSMGKSPDAFDVNDKIDIGKSLATFYIIYDGDMKPLSSSGLLSQAIPKLPKGVFSYTRLYGEDRVTWQPQPDARIALVVVSYTIPANIGSSTSPVGFVAVGRSLREVEIRENNLLVMSLILWTISVVLISAIVFLINKKWNTKASIVI